MAGASAMPFGRIDLSLGVHEPAQEIRVLEIYLVHLVLAKETLFFFGLFVHCYET